MTSRFSATKMRPSGENRRTVGFVRPLKTTGSEKPVGVVAPCAWDVAVTAASPAATRQRAEAATSLGRPLR